MNLKSTKVYGDYEDYFTYSSTYDTYSYLGQFPKELKKLDGFMYYSSVDGDTVGSISFNFEIDNYSDLKRFYSDILDYFEDKLILGDIVLSLERAEEQRIEFGHSFDREMGYLICHSVLHLLGYDHENEDEREVMRQKEEETLKSLSLTRDI